LEHLKRYLLPSELLPALTRARFDIAVAEARRRIIGLATQFIDRIGPLLQLRQQLQQRLGTVTTPAPPGQRNLSSLSQLGTPVLPRATNPLAEELTSLMPARFLDHIEYERLPHLQRYLKALLIRAERAALNPVKDQERQRQLVRYQQALEQLQSEKSRSLEGLRQIEALRWMIEEFKVSLFAQELGTAIPVSPKRLDQQLEIARQTP
jgi:ATP-dependent helicase HrpA